MCKNGRNICEPNEDFVFSCKLCRYEKCLREGMSRNKIKVGRYSKEMHSKNRMKLQKLSSYPTSCTRPMKLLQFTDADDFLTKLETFASKIYNLNWSSEIKDLEKLSIKLNETLSNGLFPKDDFLNVLSVTGVELDNRREMISFTSRVSEIFLQHGLSFLKSLPGVCNLDEKTFVDFICTEYYYIQNIFSLISIFEWIDEGLRINLSGREILISNDAINSAMGENLREITDSIHNYSKSMELTQLEFFFLGFLKMLERRSDIPQLKFTHERLLLSLTRYLENTYGQNYHVNLGKMVNFFAEYETRQLKLKNFYKLNKEYLMYMAENSFNGLLLFGFVNEQEKNYGDIYETFKKRLL